MKAAFRQSMAWLHTWSGLLLGWLLFFIFLTGTAGYFDTEIDRWMQPERPLAGAAVPTADTVAVAIRRLEQRAPQAAQWSILPPNGRENPQLRIFWRDYPKAGSGRGARGSEYIDVQTGRPVTWRAPAAASFSTACITSCTICRRPRRAGSWAWRPCSCWWPSSPA